MRFSSGPIPLDREFVDLSSCEIFRPKASRARPCAGTLSRASGSVPRAHSSSRAQRTVLRRPVEQGVGQRPGWLGGGGRALLLDLLVGGGRVLLLVPLCGGGRALLLDPLSDGGRALLLVPVCGRGRTLLLLRLAE